jgi:hypothetical protein
MRKLYYLLFYKVSSFFKHASDDGLADWKAIVIIGGAQVLLLVELMVWWTVITKIGIGISKYWIIVTGLFIAISNYYIFLYKERWTEYEEEFKNYSKQKSILISWIVFLFLIGIIASLIFAFYQMSLIDWSKYK